MTHEEFEEITTEGSAVAEKYSIPLFLFLAGTEASGNLQFATGSLVRVREGVALVTSAHVFEDFVTMGAEGRLQIGGNRFVLKQPSARVLRYSKKVDLAILMLSEDEAAAIGSPVLECDQIVGREVRKFELVGICGYPGAAKAMVGASEVKSKQYLLIGTVDTVEPDQFSIRTDKDRYDISPYEDEQEVRPLGGISGAPVFSFVTGEPHMTRRRRPAVVGWVYEGHAWSHTEDKIYAVKAIDLKEILPDVQ